MKNTASKTIELATRNIGKGSMVSSAELCLSDARSQFGKGDYGCANSRALASLSYSVGRFHEDWRAAAGMLTE